jgi:uncharacterized protein (DUF169 family)/NAD-dependent dihydropyrimidine dehydrogenase PreA subunit
MESAPPSQLINDELSGEITEVVHKIEYDETRCINCGLCVAFCPVEVLEKDTSREAKTPIAVHPELCWGCETCVGQCPKGAIKVHGSAEFDALLSREKEPVLDAHIHEQYKEWAQVLKDVLGLRWHPVGVRLLKNGEPLPNVPVPRERLRYCQSLMAARRGKAFMMPANRHACPDGTSILGLTPVPKKLASGELYILFHKLDNIEAAKRMVSERPSLEARSIDATVVFPFDNAPTKADIVVVVANPEQIMWLCMATSYYTGHRFEFHASGYNAQCVESTLYPLTTDEINISFGCYGTRASSDVSDDMMFMGIPISKMDDIVKGLTELGKKAIPQSRDKIYLPPLD